MPYFFLLLLFFFFSCSTNNPLRNVEEYEGPIIEIKDLNTLYSDSAQAKFKLKSEWLDRASAPEQIKRDHREVRLLERSDLMLPEV